MAQLVPLPPAIWTALPGRGWVVRNYELLELPLPWLPLTLAPDRAIASLLWLLPAIATLLAVVVLGAFRARWIAWVLVGMTGAGVVLGALQVVGGTGGAYLYEITNEGVAVGFFANANHTATLLLISIPFIAALQGHAKRRSSSRRNASAVTVLTTAAFAVVVVGLLTNQSLAGIGLGVPVVLASFLAIGSRGKTTRPWLGVAAGLVSIAAVAIIVLGPFGNNLIGEQSANADLTRQTSFPRTLRAAGDYLPVGSGVGSFLTIYNTQEPVEKVTRTYMNHAHSDWLEILLETGLVGVGLAAVFLLWWFRRARSIWRSDDIDLFGRAAVIATATLLVHSTVDYPLRTAALSAVFAACLGLMTGARPVVPRRKQASSPSRHLSI
jgi:O-antigen ligase